MKTLIKLILILAIALVVCVVKAFPQALSIGTGYTSEGLTAAMFTAEYKQHVIYFKSIQDAVSACNEQPGYIEKHEYTVGYGFRVHEYVTLLAGVGQCQNQTVFEYQYGNGFKQGLKMNCVEYGWRWDFFKKKHRLCEHVNMSLTALMSTYTGVSGIVSVRYVFK